MKIKDLIKYVIVISFLVPSNAYAYLDPGSGGFIIQMLIAFIASIVIFFKNGMMYVKNFFFKFSNFFLKKKTDKQKENKKEED